MEVFVLPALLVMLSAVLRSVAINKSSTPLVLAEVVLGLPVDLMFVALSVAISIQNLTPDWGGRRDILIVGIILTGAVQLAFIYKPCKEYLDEQKLVRVFFLWFLNALITFGVFLFLVKEVVQ